MQKLKAINLFIILIFLASCQGDLKRFQYSLPNKKSITTNEEYKKISIIHTGNFNENSSVISEIVDSKILLSIGGSNALKGYISTLRETIEAPTLLLDTGNFISFNSVTEKRNATIKLYSELNYDAVLLTESELLNIPNEQETQIPFIAGNIIDLKSDSITTRLNNKAYTIKDIEGVKIALIGLSLYNKKSQGEDGLSGIYFDDPIARFITIKNEIGKRADLIILLLHAHRDQKAFNETIKRLPPNSVDLVLGNDGEAGLRTVNGQTVVTNKGDGKYIGLIDIYIDDEKNFIAKQTRSYPPIKLCSQFFDVSADCHIDRNDLEKIKSIKESNYKLIKARVLGKDLEL
ncbi:hypothetical protein M900_0518 [Bacteriovorax sp. Seq25_V]|nr:hypothetical protein M900_0518 [Bacteriovorax sp. Seq25_V]